MLACLTAVIVDRLGDPTPWHSVWHGYHHCEVWWGKKKVFQEDLEEREWVDTASCCFTDFFQPLGGRRAWIVIQAGVSKPANSSAFAHIIVWLKTHLFSHSYLISLILGRFYTKSMRSILCTVGAQGLVERAENLHLLGDKPVIPSTWVGCRFCGYMD